MQVEVEMLGPLRRYFKDGGQRARLEVEPGTTVGQVLGQLGLNEQEAWNASVEGRLVDPSQPLDDGAHILVFPPIVGG